MTDAADTDRERARAAKLAVARLLAGQRPVCAIGLTRVQGRYAVKVVSAVPLEAGLPPSIDGVPVLTEISGTVRKRTTAGRRLPPAGT